MSWKNSSMLVFPILLLMCGWAAGGGCPLEGYDHTPPPAISATVQNRLAQFVWSSDLDTRSQQKWIWNFIKNIGTAPLGVNWVKGKIKVPSTDGIPPGEADCAFVPVAEAVIDYDAPILVGYNKQSVQAAAYTRQQAAHAGPPTIFVGSRLDDGGKSVDFRVEISSAVIKEGFELTFYRSPEIVAGLSLYPQALSPQQLDSLIKQSDGQRVRIERASLNKFMGPEAATKLVEELYSKEQVKQRLEEEFLFFTGAEKVTITLQAPKAESREAELIVFDLKHKPLLVSTVDLLAPVR
jgi:hypothetical protein